MGTRYIYTYIDYTQYIYIYTLYINVVYIHYVCIIQYTSYNIIFMSDVELMAKYLRFIYIKGSLISVKRLTSRILFYSFLQGFIKFIMNNKGIVIFPAIVVSIVRRRIVLII